MHPQPASDGSQRRQQAHRSHEDRDERQDHRGVASIHRTLDEGLTTNGAGYANERAGRELNEGA